MADAIRLVGRKEPKVERLRGELKRERQLADDLVDALALYTGNGGPERWEKARPVVIRYEQARGEATHDDGEESEDSEEPGLRLVTD